MRIRVFLLFVFVLFLGTAFSQDEIIDIWGDNTPNLVEGAEDIDEVWDVNATWGTLVSKVSTPAAYVYLPPADIATGTAVVICPGGGYGNLAWDHEGWQVAEWFNSIGVAGIILKYRLPDPAIVDVRHIAPIQDAHRAIRLVRSRAQEWNINPDQVGIMGFSAGGHLAGSATVHADSLFANVDALDTLSAAPNFTILGYPVVTMDAGTHGGSKSNLLGGSPSQDLVDYFSVEKNIDENTPPIFISVASNDGTVQYEPNSKTLYDSLQAASIPSELWVYEETVSVDHGFGMGFKSKESIEWSWRLAKWMQSNGWSSIVPEKPRYTFLNITQTQFGFSSAASSEKIYIECDTTWALLSEVPEWITFDKQQGEKSDTLAFKTTINETGVARSANIAIGHAQRQDTLNIVQAADGKFGQLLIGGEEPNAGEQELMDAALQAGYVLSIKHDDSLENMGIETDKVDFVLVSDSNSRSLVDDLYYNATVPVMIMEVNVLTKMGMTIKREFGQERNVNQLTILVPEHQLAAGLTGDQIVFTEEARLNYGMPGDQALKIASVTGDAEKIVIFAYESGVTMADGNPAPGKRIGFFIPNSSSPFLSDSGIALFQAAITWMLDETSQVEKGENDVQPGDFVLLQNYPNPFNPVTQLSFSLPKASHVNLSIYNNAGQLVENLVDRDLKKGMHHIKWNARAFANGVYFYTLCSDDFTITKKMVLLK